MVKTGRIGDQFNSEWCHFSTAITLFNQVIHNNEKVKPKKLSSFSLKSNVKAIRILSIAVSYFSKSGTTFKLPTRIQISAKPPIII